MNGTGFVPGSVVNWTLGTATTPLTTNFVNGTQLTATVPASLIATAGAPSVTVVNPMPGGGVSNVAFFQITNPVSSVLLNMTDYATGNGPYGVATGDFNRDGKLDFAVSNSSVNTVSIVLGNGDGTFQPEVPYATGNGPSVVTLGDFNNDGALDLAVANQTDDTVSILLGNGDGTFKTKTDFAAGGRPSGIVAADFNGDGKLDLAMAACSHNTDNTLFVLLGNGDGTFQAPVSYTTGNCPQGPVVGDFNGDGK